MFHEESLLTSFFKLLNLAVLFGVGAYIFKTRILSGIREMIDAKKEKEKALNDEKHALKLKLKAIEHELIEQQALCAKIKDNAHRWTDRVATEQQGFEQEKETRAQEQEARVKRQSIYLSTLKVRQGVLPKALAEAQKTLETHFEQQAGHLYMQNTVRYMRKV